MKKEKDTYTRYMEYRENNRSKRSLGCEYAKNGVDINY